MTNREVYNRIYTYRILIIFFEDYNLLTKLAKSGGLFNKILVYLCLKIGIKWKKKTPVDLFFIIK